MRSIENISEELFDKIRSRVSNIKLGNNEGAVTTDPKQARFFEFTFRHKDLPIGAVTISLNEEDKLQVYFSNSMVEDADSSTSDAWYGFLKELSKFSSRNMLNYKTHNVTKERLDKKDYKFLTQRNQDEVMENRLHGTSQKSFLEQGKAKLIIKHNKTVDETKMGARSRDISAIYIENNQGERFKFVNNYLPGARAMARHVSNEGYTRDDRGAHIVEIMQEMQQLKHFVRSAKTNEYVNEDAQDVIEAATDRYYGLKDTLKGISGAKGYADYFENWVPNVIDVEENDIEDLKSKLTRQVFDDRMSDTLPSVSRALAHRAKTKEAKMDKDAETRSDDELDAKIASRAGDIVGLSNDDANIQVFKNETDESELKNYFNVMKNSDMDTKAKNRNLVINVIEYIANNHVDDATGVALSGIDYDDQNQYNAAIKITKKYLQGKVDVNDRAAKKDLYGKEKKEDITFEAYEEGIDMITEGTWALPTSGAEVEKMNKLMQNPIPLGDGGEDATNAIAFAFGDDTLYDNLGDAGDQDPTADARPIIMDWLDGVVGTFGGQYDKYMSAIADANRMGQMELPLDDDVQTIENEAEVEEAGGYYGQMNDPIMFKGKEVDMDKLDYDMQDVSDEMFNVNAPVYYTDGTEVDSGDMEELEGMEEFHMWVMQDYMDNQAPQEAVEGVDEVAESIARMKAMAGVGSKAKSNHGIHEGEEGYQITPRSIVARQMRKLQDIEQGK